jgi:hypothetical protein
MFNNKTNIKPKPKHEKMSSPNKSMYQTLNPNPMKSLSSNKIDIKPLTQIL